MAIEQRASATNTAREFADKSKANSSAGGDRRRRSEPTARDLEFLRALVDYKRAHDGCWPPTRTLMRACDAGSTSVVNYHLGRLEDFGLIQRQAGKCQGIITGGRWTFVGKE